MLMIWSFHGYRMEWVYLDSWARQCGAGVWHFRDCSLLHQELEWWMLCSYTVFIHTVSCWLHWHGLYKAQWAVCTEAYVMWLTF
jgi:hypothetical protein